MTYLKPPAPLCQILRKSPWQIRAEAEAFAEKVTASTILCDLPTLAQVRLATVWARHTSKTRVADRKELLPATPAPAHAEPEVTRRVKALPPLAAEETLPVEMTVEEVNDISGFNLEVFAQFEMPANAESLIEDLEVFSLPLPFNHDE
jgi:hypothetical protein